MRDLRSFSRTISRSISDRQKQLLASNSKLGIADFISRPFNKFYLEIGFGSGENLLQLAKDNPAIGIIGVEPFINGAIKIISAIYENNLTNIFVYVDDIKTIINQFDDNFFANIFILFPDPWPKKKQQKRRLLNAEFLSLLTKKTSDNILFATDDANYFDYVSKVCLQENLHYQEIQRPAQLVISKYEKKSLSGVPRFMIIHKPHSA